MPISRGRETTTVEMGTFLDQDFAPPGAEAVTPRQSPKASQDFKGIVDISWPSPLPGTEPARQRVPQGHKGSHNFSAPQGPSCRLPMGRHKSFPPSLPSFVSSLVLFSPSLTPSAGVLADPSLGCFLVCKGHPLLPDICQAIPVRPSHPFHVEGHVL